MHEGQPYEAMALFAGIFWGLELKTQSSRRVCLPISQGACHQVVVLQSSEEVGLSGLSFVSRSVPKEAASLARTSARSFPFQSSGSPSLMACCGLLCALVFLIVRSLNLT